MPDDGAVAVAEAPVVEAVQESSQSTPVEKQPIDKQDNRKQPDGLRKRIADLRRQADSVIDPAEKQQLLDDAKELNNRVGKVGAYEQVYPTVREARETKALFEAVGGKDGVANLQRIHSNAQEIDRKFEVGDTSLIPQMFDEAPEGMVKLAPAIFAHLEKTNPEAYEKAVSPHAIKFLDKSGFPEAFDDMVALFKSGKTQEGDALALKLARFVAGHRQATATQETKANPEVERLQRELQERNKKDSDATVDRVYNAVNTHAGPVIDKFLKPIVSKLGLSTEQYSDLREAAWKQLQDTRNKDETYKLTVNSKFGKNADDAAAYMKGETESRAEAAARHVANFRYGHQLRNGVVKTPSTTTGPVTPNVQRGKEPSPSEIDYGRSGMEAIKKAGLWDAKRHHDMADVIMDGIAPMKGGGIRKWK